jgi:hypothetical protein
MTDPRRDTAREVIRTATVGEMTYALVAYTEADRIYPCAGCAAQDDAELCACLIDCKGGKWLPHTNAPEMGRQHAE